MELGQSQGRGVLFLFVQVLKTNVLLQTTFYFPTLKIAYVCIGTVGGSHYFAYKSKKIGRIGILRPLP